MTTETRDSSILPANAAKTPHCRTTRRRHLPLALLALLLHACGEDQPPSSAMLQSAPAAVEDRYIFMITDVMVWDMKSTPPEGFEAYTGVSTETTTDPFKPDVEGSRVTGIDVNSGIGGDDVAIYVKYDLINTTNPTEDTRVLTDIAVTHWGCDPWGPPQTPDGKICPADGWDSANGVIRGVKGGLTPGTKGSCWCNGLVAQYEPLSEVDTYVSNLFMSRTPNTAPEYPKYAAANQGVWAMKPTTPPLDIHRGCGDDWSYVLIKADATISPAFPSPPPAVSDEMKLRYMQQFAPYTYMDTEEEYFPSTVEFSFDHLRRFEKDGRYWVQTIEPLESPSSVLPYFAGDLDTAQAYAFWVEKEFNIHEMVYFFYYPYNRGKEKIDTIWGNHVGDWEHATVRLGWEHSDSGWELVPVEVYLSQHSGGDTREWNEVLRDGNSPVVYSARGSHAMYFEPGEHVYKTLPVVGDLTDVTSKGRVFELSAPDKLVAFDWATKRGLSGDPWPTWMSDDFSSPGADPADPNSGGIYRWGNPEEGCVKVFGICRLEDGPTGPVSKDDVWNPSVFE